MTNRDTVINFMINIKGRTPILLISKAAKIFKSIYSGRVYNIKNEEDIKSIENMNISKINRAIIIEDLSSLYNDEDLLKLIEESKLQLILLAYRDNLSDTLVSRCKSILKIPDIEVKHCNYINEKSALDTIKSSNYSYDIQNMYLAENCPNLMRDMTDTQYLRYKDRVLNILANIGGNKNESM